MRCGDSRQPFDASSCWLDTPIPEPVRPRSTGRARAARPVRYVLLDAPFRLAQAAIRPPSWPVPWEQGEEFLVETGTGGELPQRGDLPLEPTAIDGRNRSPSSVLRQLAQALFPSYRSAMSLLHSAGSVMCFVVHLHFFVCDQRVPYASPPDGRSFP